MDNESGKKPVTHKKHVARLERERQQSRMILYVFIGILSAVVLLLVYGYLDINYFQLQKPVAKVGETEILAKDFQARVRLQRQQLLMQYSQYSQYAQVFGMDVTAQLQQIQSSLDSSEATGQTVLDQLINEELIRQEAAKRGIVVSEAELDEVMRSAFGYFPDGTPTPSVTPTNVTLPDVPEEAFTIVTKTPVPSATPEFTATVETIASDSATTGTPAATATVVPSATPTATLVPTSEVTFTPEPTATPYTLEGYQTEVDSAAERMEKLGFKVEDYKSLFEAQLLQEKLQESITADISNTQQQVWARHILVQDGALAVTIIEKLKSGGDFAALAQEFSEDGSAATGGDLGWFGTGAMVPEFETAAFALEKPGDFTLTPVQSQFGLHIIQLIAKQDRPLSAEQYDTAKNTAFQEWLTAAREEYSVETFDFWKQLVPTEPNFITIATDSAIEQLTAIAKEPTATPE